MSDSVDRSSFWTTVPGLLTGSAALITASVGAFAVLAPGTYGSGPGPTGQDRTGVPTASEAPDGPVVSSPLPSSTPAPDPPGATDLAGAPPAAAATEGYLLREGGGIDVDSGQFGSGVEDAEVRWHGSYVRVSGDKRVQVDEVVDGAGCARALERGLDGEAFEPPKVEGGLIVCVRSDQGRLSIVVVDPPTDGDRLPVQVASVDSQR